MSKETLSENGCLRIQIYFLTNAEYTSPWDSCTSFIMMMLKCQDVDADVH